MAKKSIVMSIKKFTSHQAIVLLTIFLAIFAGISVIFTKKQISIYEETTKLDLRAYTVIENVRMDAFNVDEKVGIGFDIRNIGKTPAYKVKQITRFENRPFEDEDILSTQTPTTNEGVVIGTGLFYHQSSRGFILTNDRFIAINNEQDTLYVMIVITYEDIFSEQHYTRIHARCDITSERRFRSMYKHNNSD